MCKLYTSMAKPFARSAGFDSIHWFAVLQEDGVTHLVRWSVGIITCRLFAAPVLHIVVLTQIYALHTLAVTLTLLHECWHHVCIALVLWLNCMRSWKNPLIKKHFITRYFVQVGWAVMVHLTACFLLSFMGLQLLHWWWQWHRGGGCRHGHRAEPCDRVLGRTTERHSDEMHGPASPLPGPQVPGDPSSSVYN